MAGQAGFQLGIVEEACVFGISDKEIGNQIGAAIVLRAGIASPPQGRQGVADALQGKIAHFKLPHEVFFFRELPKNANGKTQRSEVVRQVLASRA